MIELSTSVGQRRLKLGPEFRVSAAAGLHAELDALLGAAIVAEDEHLGPAPARAAAGSG